MDMLLGIHFLLLFTLQLCNCQPDAEGKTTNKSLIQILNGELYI